MPFPPDDSDFDALKEAAMGKTLNSIKNGTSIWKNSNPRPVVKYSLDAIGKKEFELANWTGSWSNHVNIGVSRLGKAIDIDSGDVTNIHVDYDKKIFSTAAVELVIDATNCSGWNFSLGKGCTLSGCSKSVIECGGGCALNIRRDNRLKCGSYCTVRTWRNCEVKCGNNCSIQSSGNCYFEFGHRCTFLLYGGIFSHAVRGWDDTCIALDGISGKRYVMNLEFRQLSKVMSTHKKLEWE